MDDIHACIRSSSPRGLQETFSAQNVRWNDWVSFLRQYFRSLPNVTRYHHFIFKKEGTVSVKHFANSEPKSIRLLTGDLTSVEAAIIEAILPEPIPIVRQWYLYKNVRQYVKEEENKDKVAPKPLEPEPKAASRKKKNVESSNNL